MHTLLDKHSLRPPSLERTDSIYIFVIAHSSISQSFQKLGFHHVEFVTVRGRKVGAGELDKQQTAEMQLEQP